MKKFLLFFFLLIIGLYSKSFGQERLSSHDNTSVKSTHLYHSSSLGVNLYKDTIPCPGNCNFIKNGDFECLSSDIFDSTNDVSPFYYNKVYGWQSGWGMPNINTGSDTIYHNSAYLKAEWNNGVYTGAGIYQAISNLLVPNVDYELTYSYKKPSTDAHNSPTALHISLADFTPVIPTNGSKPSFFGSIVSLDSSSIGYDGGNWHAVGPITFSFNNDTSLKKLVIYPDVSNLGNTFQTIGDILIDNIVIKPKLKFNFPSVTNICLGQTITITDTVPTVNIISWAWTSTAGFGSLTKNITVTPNETTIYTLTATDANGCQYTGSIRVIVSEPTPVQFNLPNPITVCSGQTVTIGASVAGITSSNCHWSSNPSGVYSTNPSITVTPMVSTTYTVTTDVNGCQTTGTFDINIIPVQFNLPNPYTICLGASATITASVGGPTTSNCQWSSIPVGSYPDTTTITVSPTRNTTYTVVTDVGGCKTTGTFVVYVIIPDTVNISSTWIDECKSIVSFSFDSVAPNVNYIWHTPSKTTTISNSPINTLNVNWNYNGPDTVSFDGYDIYRGCHVYHGTLVFDPNSCIPNSIQLSSLTASQIIVILGDTSVISNNTNPIIFNGTTTIDKNITFNNCPNLMLGTNARINIIPGKTLTFNNCTLKQTCNCSWNGIYTQNFTAKIVLTNDSVRDAQNAVVSANGGNFQITSTKFVNDSIGLFVRNYNPPWMYNYKGKQFAPASHPGSIVSSTFIKNKGLSGYFSNSNLTGIIVDTVYNLTLGDSVLGNFYSLLQWGIKIQKSEVIINNSSFDSIFYINLSTPSYSGSEPNEAAIFCKTVPGAVVQPSMPLINEVTVYKSEIDYCNTGIYSYHTQMSITANILAFISHNCIHLKDFESPTIIMNNYVYQSSGIYDVSNNLHNYTIVAEQSNANASVTLDISYNYVGDVNGFLHSGIMVRNCNGSLYGSSHCILQDNTLLYSPFTPPILYEYGISAYNCNYAKIIGNAFQSATPPNTTYHNKLLGILLSANQNAQVSTNQIIKVGDGIYVEGNSLGAQYYCNDFDNCWYGFFFSEAALSNQLLKHTASDNYWYDIPLISDTSASRRMMGNSISNVLINWYHRGSTTDITNMFSPFIVPNNPLISYITPVQNIPASSCHIIPESTTKMDKYADRTSDATTDDTLIANEIVRDQLIGEIVKGNGSYHNMEKENKYMSKEYAFNILEATPAYMNLGTSDDFIYQSFYDAVKNSNSGNFYQIGKYINEQNYNAARNLNSTLTGTNTIENNRIAVNRIYLDKVINNKYLGTSDSLTLLDIAYQSTITGGDAVVSARVILGIDPIVNRDDPQTKSIKEQENIVNPLTIKVYPNPANDKLYIVPDDLMNGIATVEIFDMTGKLVYKISINSDIKLQTLNISSIKTGIYNLRITVNDQTYNQKLVIIR